MASRMAGMRQRVEALPPPAVDGVIAVGCYLATVALPVKVFSQAGWPLFLLAALASLPLVWRRRAPVLAAALVGAGTVGLATVGSLGNIPLPYGQLVATYTVASLAAPRWRLPVLAATVVGTVLSILVLLREPPPTLGTALLLFVVAYALGVGVRARRDRIVMLEERTARLADAAEATGARERERIAREIHDIVAHSVSLMVVQAEAGLVISQDHPSATATFGTISDTGREALAQLDRALGVLRADGPTRQPQPGLDELPSLVERARLAGLAAELTETGDRRPVPADLAAAVYRLVQEAVTNTIKHARAERLRIHLAWSADALLVDVTDDGRRAVPAGSARSGRGLVGMRERVDAFGGVLSVGVGAGGTGFRVAAEFPVSGVGHG